MVDSTFSSSINHPTCLYPNSPTSPLRINASLFSSSFFLIHSHHHFTNTNHHPLVPQLNTFHHRSRYLYPILSHHISSYRQVGKSFTTTFIQPLVWKQHCCTHIDLYPSYFILPNYPFDSSLHHSTSLSLPSDTLERS
jgi:hypothetical protein